MTNKPKPPTFLERAAFHLIGGFDPDQLYALQVQQQQRIEAQEIAVEVTNGSLETPELRAKGDAIRMRSRKVKGL